MAAIFRTESTDANPGQRQSAAAAGTAATPGYVASCTGPVWTHFLSSEKEHDAARGCSSVAGCRIYLGGGTSGSTKTGGSNSKSSIDVLSRNRLRPAHIVRSTLPHEPRLAQLRLLEARRHLHHREAAPLKRRTGGVALVRARHRLDQQRAREVRVLCRRRAGRRAPPALDRLAHRDAAGGRGILGPRSVLEERVVLAARVHEGAIARAQPAVGPRDVGDEAPRKGVETGDGFWRARATRRPPVARRAAARGLESSARRGVRAARREAVGGSGGCWAVVAAARRRDSGGSGGSGGDGAYRAGGRAPGKAAIGAPRVARPRAGVRGMVRGVVRGTVLARPVAPSVAAPPQVRVRVQARVRVRARGRAGALGFGLTSTGWRAATSPRPS